MTKTIITTDIKYNIKNTSLALGFFDGIHKGHQKVLKDAINYSKKLGTKSTVLTFKNHPVELLYNVKPEFITTPEERIEIFKQLGFDIIIMADFTKEIAQLNANEYFNTILMNLEPKSISIGYNHKFGANQSGDISFLNDKAKKHNFILSISDAVKDKNEVTSSTLIRNLIKNGNMQKANTLLYKPYSLKGTVIKGKQRGRLMNFPTANIAFQKNKIVPKFGAYFGFVNIDYVMYKAIANVGLRPTFNDLTEPLLEIHIFNFDKNIYNKVISFEFVKQLRNEIKFKTPELLKEQIETDIIIALQENY